ncbi:AAA family ATPase [Actinopolymorpha pittospori]|uniref:Kinase n=1 Tax=Actinopolymorpha pittospori TaxID=648752 RepID=A0A927RD78_9ACTN|nr:AAA family ATPase [Actinopolymorpha pittospori]MBE1612077.1 putative kinase [Actinopolymorpha pittospori]
MTSADEAAPPSPARLWPTLVVVTGPAGSGKTTLAHRLARTIGCPAICRDEIKEGMVHAHGPGFTAAVGDPLTRRTYPLVFDVVRLLLDGGVTVVVEAAWEHHPWERGLAPLATSADLRVIRCHTPHEEMLRRQEQRLEKVATRAAHNDRGSHSTERPVAWEAIHIDAPTLDVDTSDGYVPELDRIVAFINT